MRLGKRIRRGAFCFGLAILAGAGAAMMSAGSPPVSGSRGKVGSSDLIVHEWGTFLGMNGSDGASLDGMYHEEHALPAFVHSRSRDQLRLPFVFPQGRDAGDLLLHQGAAAVSASASAFRMASGRSGIRRPALVNPALPRHAETPDRLSGGRICWQAEVIPVAVLAVKRSEQRQVELPATSSDALWNHARRGRRGVRHDK